MVSSNNVKTELSSGLESTVMTVSVCLFVCLQLHLCFVHVTSGLAQTSSGDVEICYVLKVKLWVWS